MQAGLQLSKQKFFRLKRGQSAAEAERILSAPVNCAFAGGITEVKSCRQITVMPFETYSSIAAREGVEEGILRSFNGDRLLFPACRLFIPIGG